MLRDRIRRELSIFHQLKPDVQKFVLAIFCQIIANSLIFVFANAYLFVSTNNILSIAIFNLAVYLALLIGFYLNTLLVRFIKAKQIFIVSSVIQGVMMVILLLLENIGLWQIFGVGAAVGLVLGIYWANRNYMYPAITHDLERDYISGIVTLVGNLSSVILPLLAGWLIVWSRAQVNLKAAWAYMVIMGFGVLVLMIGTFFLSSIQELPTLKVTQFWPKKISSSWKLFRIFVLASSLQMAIGATMTEMITLKFIGDEGVLGLIKSVLAVVVGVIIYALGRKMKPRDRYKYLFVSTLFLLGSVLLLMISFSQLTLILYLITMIIATNIFWFVYPPIMSRATEMQDQGLIEDNYAYVLDHELFIDMGRIAGLIFMLVVLKYLSERIGVTIVFLVGAFMQFLGMSALKKLIKIQNSATA